MRIGKHDFALVMFDLDGTLLDTVLDMSVALDQALVACGYPAVGVEAVRRWVGNGSLKLISRALANARNCSETELEQADIKHVQQVFFDHYDACCCDQLIAYPGVIDALQALQKRFVAMACITNKPSRFSGKVLAAAGMAKYFDLTLSGDSLPKRKPDPMPLQHALGYFNCSAQRALMVGDSCNDILAARAAGMAVAAVDYGYNHGQPLPQPGSDEIEAPDWLVTSLAVFFNSNAYDGNA